MTRLQKKIWSQSSSAIRPKLTGKSRSRSNRVLSTSSMNSSAATVRRKSPPPKRTTIKRKPIWKNSSAATVAKTSTSRKQPMLTTKPVSGSARSPLPPPLRSKFLTFARANVKNFDRSGGGSGDLALPETGFVVSIGCLGQVDVFATVAALEFFQIGLRLMVVRFGGGDFLRTVAALEFIELVLSTLLLRDRDFPVSFGRIALLL